MSRRAATPAQYNRYLAMLDDRAYRDDIESQHDRLAADGNALVTREEVAALLDAGTVTRDQADRLLIERQDRTRR